MNCAIVRLVHGNVCQGSWLRKNAKARKIDSRATTVWQ
jgi:hypothetical protein